MIVIIDFTITIMVMINNDDNYFKNNINNNDNNNDTKDQNTLGLYLFMVHILHFFFSYRYCNHDFVSFVFSV